jgi:hypothetical protein
VTLDAGALDAAEQPLAIAAATPAYCSKSRDPRSRSRHGKLGFAAGSQDESVTVDPWTYHRGIEIRL